MQAGSPKCAATCAAAHATGVQQLAPLPSPLLLSPALKSSPGSAGQFNGTSKKQALHALQFLYLNTLSIIPQLLRL